jgi:hypothetical protein
MGYEKNHYQWPNAEKTFFDCHLSFFTQNRLIFNRHVQSQWEKAAMNAACVCILHNGINKTPQFLPFSMAKGGTKNIGHLSIAEG